MSGDLSTTEVLVEQKEQNEINEQNLIDEFDEENEQIETKEKKEREYFLKKWKEEKLKEAKQLIRPVKREGKWSYELDYKKTKQFLVKTTKELYTLLKYDSKRRIYTLYWKYNLYLFVAITQLINGGRASEIFEAVLKYLKRFRETRKKKDNIIYVQTKKRKKTYLREIRVAEKYFDAEFLLYLASHPKIEYFNNIFLYWEGDKEKQKQKIKTIISSYTQFLEGTFGFSSHALRHALVTYLGSKGVAPQIIAKITGHSRVDYIIRYTEEKKASEILEKLYKDEF